VSGYLCKYYTACLRRVFCDIEGIKGEEGAVSLRGVVRYGEALDLAKGGSIVRRKEVLIRLERILRR
jgi:hypothetical protein